MEKLRVYWKHNQQGNDGHWEEDNPDADYPNEVYRPASWTETRYMEERPVSDILKIFKEEDGDCDFSHTLLYICDQKDRVLFAVDKCENMEDRKRKETDLLERIFAMDVGIGKCDVCEKFKEVGRGENFTWDDDEGVWLCVDCEKEHKKTKVIDDEVGLIKAMNKIAGGK